jgi:zinc protease
VYGIGAGGNLSRSPHQERTFSLQFGCDPKRVDELVTAAQKEIAAVEADNIIDTEKKHVPLTEYLDKVKATFQRSRETELRTNRFWLNRLSSSYHYGDDPLDIPDTTKLVGRMTPANVEAAAKHFLDPKQTYEAIRLPEEKP